MSGNSSFSIPQTVPIVSSRDFDAVAISAVEEREPVLADLQLVPVFELGSLDALAVDERAVEAALVLDRERAVLVRQHRVLPGDGHVVEEDPAVGGTPDRRLLRLGAERLPRSPAAGPDYQRGSLDSEIVERGVRRAVTVVRRERLRHLGAGLVLDEESAAARAVVRGFRVLEAALLAVDVRHAGPLRRRGCLRGEDLGQPFDVELVEDALPLRLLQPGDELRTQDVDLAVEQTALVRDLELLLRQVV